MYRLGCVLRRVLGARRTDGQRPLYGDGDEHAYVLYNTSIGGSKLWYTVSGNRLYVALVVSRAVNDNVFGNRSYTQLHGSNSS